MANIKIIKPGIATYVEDEGRFGFYHIGVPPGGCLDQLSYKAGNILLGNDKGLACLEVALMGPELEFSHKTYMVVTGACMAPIINGEKKDINVVLEVPAGAHVKFDFIKGGARSYICVAGGIDVPLVMGSRSTYPLGGIGGFKGRKLEANDILEIGACTHTPKVGFSLSEEFKLNLEPVETLRVITGLHDYKLKEESLDLFFSETFKVSSEADRTGYRFKGGTPFAYKDLPQPFGAGSNPSNIADACYPVGSIQAPGGIEPIVLQRDAPSGGGFGMIGTVISCDLDKMGQIPPNYSVKFKKVDMEEALSARKVYKDKFVELKKLAY